MRSQCARSQVPPLNIPRRNEQGILIRYLPADSTDDPLDSNLKDKPKIRTKPSSNQATCFSALISRLFSCTSQLPTLSIRINPLSSLSTDSQETASLSLRSSHKPRSPLLPTIFFRFEQDFVKLLRAENRAEEAKRLCLIIASSFKVGVLTLDYDGTLAFYLNIYQHVSTADHFRVFQRLSHWTAAYLARHFPGRYGDFLAWLLDNCIRYEIYLIALTECHKMETSAADEFLQYLSRKLLKYDPESLDYIYIGRFNRHFLEFAARFPKISSTRFISAVALPEGMILTQTLDFIMNSALLVEGLQRRAEFSVAQVLDFKDRLRAFFALPMAVTRFAEQLDIICDLRGLELSAPCSQWNEILDFVFVLLEQKTIDSSLFSELRPCRVAGLLVDQQNYQLLNAFLQYLPHRFDWTRRQVQWCLMMADTHESPTFLISLMGWLPTVLLVAATDAGNFSDRWQLYSWALRALNFRPRRSKSELFSARVNDEPEDVIVSLPHSLTNLELTSQNLLGLGVLVVLRLWSFDLREEAGFWGHFTRPRRYFALDQVDQVVNTCLQSIKIDSRVAKYRLVFKFDLQE